MIITILSLFVCRIFSSNIYTYLSPEDSDTLKEFFTVNIGIMKLKQIGNINLIDPIDVENVSNTIKSTIELVFFVKMDKKSSLLKSFNILKRKNIVNDDKKELFEKKISFFDEENSSITEIFKIMNSQAPFKNIAKIWLENFQNPVYLINVGKPFDRIFKENKTICEIMKIDNKYTLDLLFYGEIERIDKMNVVTIYVYSYYHNKDIASITVVSDSEKLIENVRKKIKTILPKIFNVNYASLEVITLLNTDMTSDNNDSTRDIKDTLIYLNSDYIGKNKVSLEFIVPGSYVLKLVNEKYNHYYQNIKLNDFEDKKLKITLSDSRAMQITNFYIEPFGTKIFINSRYEGKTPFQKALPSGNYVIYAQNDLFEDLRYVFSIKDIKNEEMNIIYHLKSKNIDTQFKQKRILYYISFWNFTFSLTTMIPVVIFAYDYFYKFNYAQTNYNEKMGITQETSHLQYAYTEEGRIMDTTYKTLYGVAAFMISYTVLSLGWLFYSLGDYLLTLEKKDFIPILDFYNNEKGDVSILFGGEIKLDKK